jgi:tetratricopeptide (TPR) repeat protein
MRMRSLVIRSTLFAVVLSVATAAHADEAKDQSRAAFRKGVAAAKENNYAAARDFFIDAYRLFPHPSILLNLGIAHSKTGELVEAEQELVKFIADDGGATTDEVKSAQRTLSEVRDKLGTIALEVKPATAKVSLDGKPVTLLSNQVTPIRGIGGRHTLRIEAEGHNTYEQPIEVVTKIEIPLKVDLVPTGAAPAGAGGPGVAPPEEPASGGGSGRTIAGWSLLGVGALSGAAWAYFGLRTFSKQDEWGAPKDQLVEEQVRKDGERSALIADIAGGVTIVAAGVGAFLLLTKPKAKSGPQAGVFIAPSFTGVRGRF